MTIRPPADPGVPQGLVCVVLAGGAGTRLWPRSRAGRPKHLLPLAPDGRSLLRHAFERASELGGEVLVVSSAEQGQEVARELPELDSDHLLLEPEPRGTGPALAWAALVAERLRPGAVMVSLHADHHIPDPQVRLVLLSAAWWAQQADRLVAVGLRPSWPSPGFGYIGMGEELPRPPALPGAVLSLRSALGFVEKPDQNRAREMVDAGTFLWNTGLFAWPARLLLEELAQFAPEVEVAVRSAVASPPDFQSAWSALGHGVIERLVLERTRKLGVLPSDLRWSDLGSFHDLHRAASEAGLADQEGNVASGPFLLEDSQGCFVDSSGGRLVVLLGAEDLAVVDTKEALLVCPLNRVQDVSLVVARLRAEGRDDLL
ncbi:MAG: mannose-1-phosphate guanylyltransferase [Candidatus Dormibacteria bacterium]